MSRARLVPLATLALALSACASAGRAREAEGAEAAAIRGERAAYNAAIARHDVEAVVAFLLPEYHVITSRSAQSHGVEANRKTWSDIFASQPGVVYVRTPERVRVNAAWGMAEETGRWQGRWRAADGEVEIAGSYAAKWHRVDGRWRLAAELFTPASCRGGAACRPPAP